MPLVLGLRYFRQLSFVAALFYTGWLFHHTSGNGMAAGATNTSEGTFEPLEINLKAFEEGSMVNKIKIALKFNEAASSSGSFYLTGHGISQKQIDGMYNATTTFFDQPLDYKLGFRVGEFGSEGYHEYGSETQSKTGLVKGSKKLDLADMVENFLYGYNEANDRAAKEEDLPDEFKKVLNDYSEVMQALQGKVHKIASLALQLTDPETAMNLTQRGEAALKELMSVNLIDAFWNRNSKTNFHAIRLNHYFDISSGYDDETVKGALRIGEHKDYNGFTILSAGKVSGLQVKNEGKWLDVAARPDAFIVNTGELMSQTTNGYWKATPHRVAATSTKRRISIPYFTSPSRDLVIGPIPGCYICNLGDFQYKRQTSGEHMMKIVQKARRKNKLMPKLKKTELYGGGTRKDETENSLDLA
mmetsp:Transcript_7531/g.14035  ORF Transcript_7531/g.14035 Transcript_7531/m.14035 type:complete len:415 (-) Transcript_7531:204-1448(-)|eukprot:CAMPEP_0197538364 /NCGR_PEP_ID=MMETSP1318-20131121/59603_1 /TAXON_ID=552666 /ORGANISM="Partenskyella glossopodia, Strain RCC365" /LENGTH=414 /DNA_ID=CAMNT_0043096759 /DNA_START=118 /DNA_END=1362 /DNA_ORIENTATION=+